MKGTGRKPRLRCRASLLLLALVAVMWTCVGVHGESRARLVNNGYEGVVVGVSPNVKEENGPALVEALKKVLTETSAGLFSATDERAYFRSVTILIPRSWSSVNVTHTARSESFENSDIRVDVKHPAYQHQPYTKQLGECGDPGQYIHLTPTYLLEDSEAKWWGPRGKSLLLEWSKLRWGVFDEIGYPDDLTYPLFYRQSNGRISHTHCAQPLVRGRRRDRLDNDGCRVTASGLPNENCQFIPYKRQTTTSSLLSYPVIMNEKVIHFCDGKDHNPDAPTKQNDVCNKRSVWDVISDHPDFKNSSNPPTQTFGDLTVRVVQQADASYALVLDYSGSMNDFNRIQKLQRTARRWLLHEVADGSNVAIINFSSEATLIRGATMITDEASRKGLADAIGISVTGSTSIGSGLRLAVNSVLAGKQNPVILLISDGEENEKPRIDDVLDEVVSSGTRVVTVAFGASADPKLEEVAQMTGGKTFTVKDIDGGQMLEDAFQGALTFQPPPPSAAQIVTILEEKYKVGGNEASSTFIVDFSVGRNLTLRLETDPTVSSAPVLIDPNGQAHTNAKYDGATSSWTILVPLAEQGQWTWKVNVTGKNINSARVSVTSQPREPTVQPIKTEVWISQGSNARNAALVVILAEVKQGNSPVLNADVRATVSPPNEQDKDQFYTLLDNGQGADTLAGDGIYSRYMTKFTSPGRYSVRAQVTDGGTALINSGFLTTLTRRRRQVENTEEEEIDDDEEMDEDYINLFLKRPVVCCGSKMPVPVDAPKTGSFHRTASGGSFKINNVPQGDIYPPARVRDLQVQLSDVNWVADTLPTNASVNFNWTATGDDLDSGFVFGYELRMTANQSDLLEENFIVHQSSNSSSWRVVDLSGFHLDVEGGEKLSITISLTLSSNTTYFALRAWDDEDNVSNVSNIADLNVNFAKAGGMTPTWSWCLWCCLFCAKYVLL